MSPNARPTSSEAHVRALRQRPALRVEPHRDRALRPTQARRRSAIAAYSPAGHSARDVSELQTTCATPGSDWLRHGIHGVASTTPVNDLPVGVRLLALGHLRRLTCK